MKTSTEPETGRSPAQILRRAADLAREPKGPFALRLPHDRQIAVCLAVVGAQVTIDDDRHVAHVVIPEELRSAADLIDLKLIAAMETSFRRGFAHGAQAAVDAVQGGAKLPALLRWLGRVADWRFCKRDAPIPPEVRTGRGRA